MFCCVCGRFENRGVIFGQNFALGLRKLFVCEYCINPKLSLWFPFLRSTLNGIQTILF